MSAEHQGPLNNLDIFRSRVQNGITMLKGRLQAEAGRPRDPEDFNYRGDLYRLALEIAPLARRTDIVRIGELMHPQPGEQSVDVAAGTGFLTVPLAERTEATVYAFDTSQVQIDALKRRTSELPIKAIHGSFSDEESLDKLRDAAGHDVVGKIDIVTSFAGIHHLIEQGQQRKLFENAGRVLKQGGRVTAADVGAGTTLAHHFETSVKTHCLTGHHEVWLSPERLRDELTPGTGLSVVHAEVVEDHAMVFDSVAQMALWAKALHAYDLPESKIAEDLEEVLGFTVNPRDGTVRLSWPLLFFKLQKDE
jgi:SAM-dependent methyltransferase